MSQILDINELKKLIHYEPTKALKCATDQIKQLKDKYKDQSLHSSFKIVQVK